LLLLVVVKRLACSLSVLQAPQWDVEERVRGGTVSDFIGIDGGTEDTRDMATVGAGAGTMVIAMRMFSLLLFLLLSVGDC